MFCMDPCSLVVKYLCRSNWPYWASFYLNIHNLSYEKIWKVMNINGLNVCLDPLLFLCPENIQTFPFISIIDNLGLVRSVVQSPDREFKSMQIPMVLQSGLLSVALCLLSINYEL